VAPRHGQYLPEGGKLFLDKNTKYIAVCTAGINVEYIDSALAAVYSLADEFHFKILYFNSFSPLYYFSKHDVGESSIFRLINYNLIDGIIMLTETIKSDRIRQDILEKANRNDIPVVSVDHFLKGCYNVNFQYKNSMKKIVKHLVEKHGFTRLNFINGEPDNEFSQERLDAYREVLEENGIPFEEERVAYGYFRCEPVEEVIRQFTESSLPFPEAIVCANDSMAIGAIKYLKEAGYRVPEDVKVTGFDGIREAMEHVPSITTSKHDYYGLIQKSMEILDAYFHGEEPEEQNWVETKPIFAESCGCSPVNAGKSSTFTRELYNRIDSWEHFQRRQIALAADLTDNDSFQGIFDNLKKYEDNFHSDRFWLCIVDDFLSQKENLMDIIEETNVNRVGYSDTMDVMLSKNGDEWLGLTDFHTASLLPNLEQILEEERDVMFLPLHVLEQTIGYVAMVYNPEKVNMYFIYQFFMNISNALENTRIHQRQQIIIDNLKLKSVHDPMTGLYNRRGFYQRVETVYSQCIARDKLLAVVSVDLNGLKQINDTYGHADGDVAISTIGKALVHVFPQEFTCARFGGDEFIVSGQVESREQVEGYCGQVKEYLDDFNHGSGKPYRVSGSIGYVAGFPGGITLDEFIKAADEKMYEDKVRYHSRSR